jgi:hypothetical protein
LLFMQESLQEDYRAAIMRLVKELVVGSHPQDLTVFINPKNQFRRQT